MRVLNERLGQLGPFRRTHLMDIDDAAGKVACAHRLNPTDKGLVVYLIVSHVFAVVVQYDVERI